MHTLPAVLEQKIAASIQKTAQQTPKTQRIECEGLYYWIKQRPQHKWTVWHRIQKIVSACIPFAMLKPTVSNGGPQSLFEEARRLDAFKDKGIRAVPVAAVSEHYLLTHDCGPTLASVLQDLPNRQRFLLLWKAVESLQRLHQKGLCHGRPSPKDMLCNKAQIYWLDLEEDPLSVMPLAQAQARDFWLLLNGLGKYFSQDTNTMALLDLYLSNSTAEIRVELKRLVGILKPLTRLLGICPQGLVGREVRCAIKINRAIDQYFNSNMLQ